MKWPCERRDAHGPHKRTWVGVKGGISGNPKVYLMGDGSVTTEQLCPGVRAHPNTMIGRGGK